MVFSIICLSFILHEAFMYVVSGLGSNLYYLLAFFILGELDILCLTFFFVKEETITFYSVIKKIK